MWTRLCSALAAGAISLGLLSGVAQPSAASAKLVAPHSSDLWAIDAVSPTDIWAVGTKVPAGGDGGDGIPLIKHYDGTVWHTVHTDVGLGELYSVSAAAPDDVWAVGESQGEIIVLHWDGTSWQRASTPTYPDHSTLFEVDVISPNRVVASGIYYSGESPCHDISLVWNGSIWKEDSGLEATLYVVSTLSPTDAWGSGSTTGASGEVGVVAHWNGSRWAETPRPPMPAYTYRIAAVADDDVWLTGMRLSLADSFIQHWNGHRWAEVADAATDRKQLTAVSASGPDDVWATGYTSGTAVLEHWDGHEWSNVDNPATGRTWAELRDVVAISSTDAWAVGTYLAEPRFPRIIIHWDGHSWTDYHRPR